MIPHGRWRSVALGTVKNCTSFNPFSSSETCVSRWASVRHRQRSRHDVSAVAGSDSALHDHLQHVRHDDAVQWDQRTQDSRTAKRLRRPQPQPALHRHLDYNVPRTGLYTNYLTPIRAITDCSQLSLSYETTQKLTKRFFLEWMNVRPEE